MTHDCIPRRVYLREQAQANGKEIPDTTPVEVVAEERPLTLREEMRRFIRQEISQKIAESGADIETFEEADDFEVEDEDLDMLTQYTVNELVDETGTTDDLEGEPEGEPIAEEEGETLPPGRPGLENTPQEAQADPPGQPPQT